MKAMLIAVLSVFLISCGNQDPTSPGKGERPDLSGKDSLSTTLLSPGMYETFPNNFNGSTSTLYTTFSRLSYQKESKVPKPFIFVWKVKGDDPLTGEFVGAAQGDVVEDPANENAVWVRSTANIKIPNLQAEVEKGYNFYYINAEWLGVSLELAKAKFIQDIASGNNATSMGKRIEFR